MFYSTTVNIKKSKPLYSVDNLQDMFLLQSLSNVWCMMGKLGFDIKYAFL